MRLRDIFGDAIPAVKQAALNCKIQDESGILQVSDIYARDVELTELDPVKVP